MQCQTIQRSCAATPSCDYNPAHDKRKRPPGESSALQAPCHGSYHACRCCSGRGRRRSPAGRQAVSGGGRRLGGLRKRSRSRPCDQATAAVKDALIGVLTGKVPGIAPVLGSTSSFGAPRAPKATERVTVSTALPASGRLMFFDGETGFVPLSRLASGKLYMSSEAAVTGVFSWLASQGHSPKDYALRVCLVNFSKDGLAELSEVA